MVTWSHDGHMVVTWWSHDIPVRCWVAWVCRGSWSPHARGRGPVVGGSREPDVAVGLQRQGELSFLALQREKEGKKRGRIRKEGGKRRRKEKERGEGERERR